MIEIINCSKRDNIGEKLTLDFLEKNLVGYNTILTNYFLPTHTSTLEIDLVVINHFGIFLLEVKHWFGKIIADQRFWQRESGESHESPISSIERKAKVFHGYISSINNSYTNLSKTGIVVLSNKQSKLEITDPRANKVFYLDNNLINALNSASLLFHQNCIRLSKENIQKIVHDLLQNKVEIDNNILGKYKILKEIINNDLYTEYQAEDINITNRKVRIKVYKIKEINSKRDIEDHIVRFKRDIEALSKLQGEDGFVVPYDFTRDPMTDDTYYLITEWVEDNTLQNLLESKSPLDWNLVEKIIINSARILNRCHENGVIHRNISPENFYILPNGNIKLGNFGLAKIFDFPTTITKAGVTLVTGKYVAPEQLKNSSLVDERSDVYSLGLIWKDLMGKCISITAKNKKLLEGHIEKMIKSEPSERTTLKDIIS